ncbi:MAG: hypothetical protein Q8R55_01360 [Candidatus Taylorbacteria bacterium]|nr:hypothetical protein [Candidatus Taylorbacteria bacterium]
MGTKIRLFFIFLAVSAVISVFSFFDVIGGVRSALIFDSVHPLAQVSDDVDNDGLSNTDESYWNTDFENPDSDGDGFIDGEEVTSRHDPTVAGPNDKMSDLNITQKAANLAISGLVEGSLKPSSLNYLDSLDSVSLAVIDDGLKTFISYPEDLKLTIIEPSPENQQAYITALEPVWEQFYKALGDEIRNLGIKLELTNDDGYSNPAFVSYFIYKRDEFNSISNNWQAVLVPSNWKQEHTNFLDLIRGFAKVNEAIAKGGDDPLRATMGLTLLIDLVERFPEILDIYSKKIKAENIPTELFN